MLIEAFDRSVARNPQARALVVAGKKADATITFRQLHQATHAAARKLAQLGIRPGNTVLLTVLPSPELYAVLGGLFRIGATAMFVDPWVGPASLKHCLRTARPQAWIGSLLHFMFRLVSQELCSIPLRIQTGRVIDFHAGEETHTAASPASDQTALLSFSSGTSGNPKSVCRTYGQLQAQHGALQPLFRIDPNGLCFSNLPIVVLSNLAAGIPCLIPADSQWRVTDSNILAWGKAVAQNKATSAIVPPSVLEQWTHASPAGAALRRVITGGGPLYPDVAERWLTGFPHTSLTAVYGSTEAEPIAATDLSLPLSDGMGICLGKPVSQVEWKIPSAASFGELSVRGRHVVPENKDGWRAMGDWVRKDADGCLWLLGRKEAGPESFTFDASPVVVEMAVRRFPGVKRAALLSVNQRRILAVEAAKSKPLLQQLDGLQLKFKFDEIRFLKIPMDRRHRSKINYSRLHRQLTAGPG